MNYEGVTIQWTPSSIPYTIHLWWPRTRATVRTPEVEQLSPSQQKTGHQTCRLILTGPYSRFRDKCSDLSELWSTSIAMVVSINIHKVKKIWKAWATSESYPYHAFNWTMTGCWGNTTRAAFWFKKECSLIARFDFCKRSALTKWHTYLNRASWHDTVKRATLTFRQTILANGNGAWNCVDSREARRGHEWKLSRNFWIVEMAVVRDDTTTKKSLAQSPGSLPTSLWGQSLFQRGIVVDELKSTKSAKNPRANVKVGRNSFKIQTQTSAWPSSNSHDLLCI